MIYPAVVAMFLGRVSVVIGRDRGRVVKSGLRERAEWRQSQWNKETLEREQIR